MVPKLVLCKGLPRKMIHFGLREGAVSFMQSLLFLEPTEFSAVALLSLLSLVIMSRRTPNVLLAIHLDLVAPLPVSSWFD